MTIYKVIHGNTIVEFVNLVHAESYAQQNNCAPPEAEERSTGPDYYTIVGAAIRAKRAVAEQLLVELYTENTLAGITTAQSDQLFDEYADVIFRIEQGAFPTALYRLEQKQPEGFVTQELIDAWKARIATYL